MSKKYKEAMDKIVLSDELKTKIIENSSKNHLPVKEKTKRTKTFYFRYGVRYAACLLLCFLAVSVSKNFVQTDIMPSATNVPSYASPAPQPTNAVSSQLPENDVLPDNIENQEPAENAQQDNINHHLTAETQSPQTEEPNIANPVEPQSPENNTTNEENPHESSSGNGDNGIESPINPSTDVENFSDLREQFGYDFKVPQYLPEGYELDKVSIMFGSLVQISYLSENDEIVYRTEKTNADISGDYNVYDTVETETINSIDTTLKSSDEVFYGAVWIDGDMSYSIHSTNGLEKDIMVKIVENIDYPAEQTEKAQEKSIVIDENSTDQDDINTPDQPTEEIYDENENCETPEQMNTMDHMDE